MVTCYNLVLHRRMSNIVREIQGFKYKYKYINVFSYLRASSMGCPPFVKVTKLFMKSSMCKVWWLHPPFLPFGVCFIHVLCESEKWFHSLIIIRSWLFVGDVRYFLFMSTFPGTYRETLSENISWIPSQKWSHYFHKTVSVSTLTIVKYVWPPYYI